MYARENINNGFWFSLGFGVAIVLLSLGCFALTEAGLDLLKGDTEMNEGPQLNPENNIRPEGPNSLPSDVPEERPRSDIELDTVATVINETIVDSILDVPPTLAVHLPTLRDLLKELQTLRAQQKPCIGSDNFKEDCFVLRAQVKETEIQLNLLFKEHPVFDIAHTAAGVNRIEDHGEMKANLKLAFRHLEDARMRLGKAIQAYDGGKSCYAR